MILCKMSGLINPLESATSGHEAFFLWKKNHIPPIKKPDTTDNP